MTRIVLLLILTIQLPWGTLSAQVASQPGPRERTHHFDIDRMPIVDAMRRFSEQAGVQWGYLPESAEEEATLIGPLEGELTIDEAGWLLLDPIGKALEWTNDRTIGVVEKGVPKELGRMLVLGARIWDVGELELPSFTFGRREIEASGASTLPELLRYLTQQPFWRSDLSNTGDQRVELRGLGRDTTLVLINGRRAGGSSASFDIDAFDLHSIPLTAVERIDVIQDFLPFDIGADAIGGMVDIVLKDDVEPLLEVNYGTAEGGAEERRASLGGGKAIGWLRVSAVLDYFERGELLGEARDRWRNQDYRRFDSVDYRSSASNPGNVQSLTPDNLPGLPTRFAAVPAHESGRHLTPQDFVATAGQQNLASLRRFRSIVPERERTSLVASADVDASSTTLLYGEIFYTHGTTVVRDSPFALSNAMVPASNAFNPFGSTVAASFLPSTLAPRTWTTEGRLARGLAGLRGEWNRWMWEFLMQHTRDTTRVTQVNELDPMRLAEALAHSDPALALDVFDDGPGGSPALIESLIAAPLRRDYLSRSTQATLRARGELLKLPAGALSLSAGAEWRESSMSIDTRIPQSPQRDLTAGFVELRVPLAEPRMSFRGIHRLAVTAAGRIDHYRDIGHVTNAQVGLTWNPVKPLTVRTTLGTSYRPPSIFELYLPTFQVPSALPDPRRNNHIANVPVTVGGNPELQTTTARSWSVGLFFEPESANHLSLAATYWSARLKERIAPVALPLLLAQEELFPGRVLRASPSAADAVAGLPGQLLALDVTPHNDGTLTASGIDATASMDADTRFGQFKPAISVTWMNEFGVVDVAGLSPVDRIGVASVLGTIPRWRGVAGVTWVRGAFSTTATMRFVASYDDFNPVLNRYNGRRVGSQTFFDAQASLQFDRYVDTSSPWNGLRVIAGITNVFNEHPPFAELGGDFGYDFTQGDLMGRFSYLRLAKRF